MTGGVTFLEEYRASRESGSTADAEVAVLREWLTLRPDAVLEDLQAHAPGFALPGLAFVTSYDDVQEVLSRNDVFSVAPYGEAMTRINRGPSFLLGMDDGPEYRRQLDRLGSAFHHDDAARVRERAAFRASDTHSVVGDRPLDRYGHVDEVAALVAFVAGLESIPYRHLSSTPPRPRISG